MGELRSFSWRNGPKGMTATHYKVASIHGSTAAIDHQVHQRLSGFLPRLPLTPLLAVWCFQGESNTMEAVRRGGPKLDEREFISSPAEIVRRLIIKLFWVDQNEDLR